MPRFLIILFFIVSVFSSIAQPVVKTHLQQFTTDNGLPSNGIKGLQWDEKTEFLWVATEAGIVRFNGVDFRPYTRDNMPSIGSERMLFITRNREENIFITDLAGNVFKIEQNKPVLWRKGKSTDRPYAGNFYLLPVSENLFLKKVDEPNYPPFSAVTDKVIGLNESSCLVLNRRSIWYNKVDIDKPEEINTEAKNILTLFKVGNSIFFSTDKNKVYLFDPVLRSVKPIVIIDESGNPFNDLIDNIHLFWETGMKSPIYIDKDKAFKLEYDGNKLISKLIFTGIPDDAYIKSVQYSEKNRMLFIGTDSKGLIVINQNLVESKRRTDNNPKNRNSYYAQIELANGNILTNEGDVIGNSTIPAHLPITGKFTFNVSLTEDSLLWYVKQDDAFGFVCPHQYNLNTGAVKAFPDLRGECIVAKSGSETFLASNLGIYKLEADSFIAVIKSPPQLNLNQVIDFKEIQPGIMAIATCNGLFRFTVSSSKLDTLLTKDKGCVRTIWKYGDYIFLGTYGSGFYIFKNGVIKKMPVDKNKYLLYSHCFVPDKYGYCWISTNRGLFKANLAELTHAYDMDLTSVYYHYFGKKDGMEMTELNGGCTPCALLMKNSTISFPSMDGLLWVNPEKAIPILPAGNIYIDEFLVDGKNLQFDSLEKIVMPANTRDILIKLGYAAWCNKENIYLDYQLNDTTNWIPISTNDDAVIRLIGLSSGRYVLRIRKLNGFGKDNFSYKELHFTIGTPWYQHWWFYLLFFLVILGIASLYSQIRNMQLLKRERHLEQQIAEKTSELKDQNDILEKNNSIKTRLISIISHDIVTPLKFVTVAGKKLMEKKAEMSEELQQETIHEMTNTAQELQLLSTNILNWIKYQNENRRMMKEEFNLHDMVNQVLGILNSLARQKNLVLKNEVPTDLNIYQFFEPLKILVYNLMTNAINFSEKGEICIVAKQKDTVVTIRVTDEGVGMTPDQIKNIMADEFIISSANIDNRKGNGLGYLIIKDLVKMTGAQLSLNSSKESGTTVSVELQNIGT